MAVNKGVIVGAVGITATGVVAAILKHKAISPVVMGGYVLAVIGGFLDLFGGGTSQLAGSIVMLAFIGTLLYEADVLTGALKIFGGGGEPGGGGGKSPPQPPKK